MRNRKFSGSIFVLALMWAGSLIAGAPEDLPVYDGVGGNFSASSTLDRDVSLSDFREKVVLVSFGFTSCQDICPATLGHLRALMSQLGESSDEVQVLFVTVDPDVDTVEHLKEYLSRFDSRFVGVTGSQTEVAAIARLFMVQHDKSDGTPVTTEHSKAKTYTDQSFLYAHSQQIYLLDGLGRTRALFFSGSPLDEMESAIRSLMN